MSIRVIFFLMFVGCVVSSSHELQATYSEDGYFEVRGGQATEYVAILSSGTPKRKLKVVDAKFTLRQWGKIVSKSPKLEKLYLEGTSIPRDIHQLIETLKPLKCLKRLTLDYNERDLFYYFEPGSGKWYHLIDSEETLLTNIIATYH